MSLTKRFYGWQGVALLAVAVVIAVVFAPEVHAQTIHLPGVQVDLQDSGGKAPVATALKIIIGLTVLSLIPAILIAMTSFTRIVIVLSMLRHAFGMQQTPPNTVIISLSLFLTIFSMLPTLQKIHDQAYEPYFNGTLSADKAMTNGIDCFRGFMIKQTREEDLMLMVELAKEPRPQTMADIKTFVLIPAFMLSELRSAFQIGFVIFLPFLLLDLVVSSVLMSMGMLMVPPMMISLPLKILMFVLIDGWNLVTYSLLKSFS